MEAVTAVKIPNRVKEVIKQVEYLGATVRIEADDELNEVLSTNNSYKSIVHICHINTIISVVCFYNGRTKAWSTYAIKNGYEIKFREVVKVTRRASRLASIGLGL